MANAGHAARPGSQFFLVVSDTGANSSDRAAVQVLGPRHDGRRGPRRSRRRSTRFGAADGRTPTKKVYVLERDDHRGVGGDEHDRGAHHGRAVTVGRLDDEVRFP